jgi:hypothetical protein
MDGTSSRSREHFPSESPLCFIVDALNVVPDSENELRVERIGRDDLW